VPAAQAFVGSSGDASSRGMQGGAKIQAVSARQTRLRGNRLTGVEAFGGLRKGMVGAGRQLDCESGELGSPEAETGAVSGSQALSLTS
jgi:hypothetical protein